MVTSLLLPSLAWLVGSAKLDEQVGMVGMVGLGRGLGLGLAVLELVEAVAVVLLHVALEVFFPEHVSFWQPFFSHSGLFSRPLNI